MSQHFTVSEDAALFALWTANTSNYSAADH